MQKLYISLIAAALTSGFNYICSGKKEDKSEQGQNPGKSIILFLIIFVISYILCILLLEGGLQTKPLGDDDFDLDKMLSNMKLGDAPF